MLSQRQNHSYLEDRAASAVANTAAKAEKPAPRLVIAKDEARASQGGGSRPWSTAGAEPEQSHNFMRGLSIALPLSVSLWAFMIWGIRALW